MDMYKSSGEENLRADAKVKSAEAITSPSGSGKDMGGTENLKADHKAMGPTDRPGPPSYAKDSRPKGVQTFKDQP